MALQPGPKIWSLFYKSSCSNILPHLKQKSIRREKKLQNLGMEKKQQASKREEEEEEEEEISDTGISQPANWNQSFHH